MNGADWRPAAGIEVLRQRARMLARAHDWFAAGRVLAVQTPVLSAAAVSELQVESIAAQPMQGPAMYLQTSPEFPMKRLLAAGIGDCYQVCPVFRDGEFGHHHNPEFTMIEWYRVGFSVEQMVQDLDQLLRAMIGDLRVLPPTRVHSYRDAMLEACGVDCRTASPREIEAALRQQGVAPAPSVDWGLDTWLDLLMGTVVGPALGRENPVVVRDYPASQAALARLRDDGSGVQVAERFELYLDGVELANGFHELSDPLEQRRRFAQDLRNREQRGQRRAPLDDRFLAALEHGLPDCAGVALGFDRLVMVTLGLRSVAETIAFPVDRA
ncbi:MAG: EF-P lysine aminoacylase EpmA [Steroidobacteraceae bacterium]